MKPRPREDENPWAFCWIAGRLEDCAEIDTYDLAAKLARSMLGKSADGKRAWLSATTVKASLNASQFT
jgi:hypothetical protein